MSWARSLVSDIIPQGVYRKRGSQHFPSGPDSYARRGAARCLTVHSKAQRPRADAFMELDDGDGRADTCEGALAGCVHGRALEVHGGSAAYTM
eukprot:4630931-Prymnesium_polylepis.1